MNKQNLKAYFLLTSVVFLWSGNIIFGRFLHDLIPPFGISFWRWLIAVLIISVLQWKKLYNFLKILKRHFYQLFVLSFFGIIISSSLQYVGLVYTSATNAGIIVALMPIAIAISTELILKEKTSRLERLGMFISILGALVLIFRGNFHNFRQLNFNIGDVILLIAALAWGVYTALLKKFNLPCSNWELIQGTSLIAVIILALILLVQGKNTIIPTFTLHGPMSIIALFYIGIGTSLFAYGGWNIGVTLIGANKAGIFLYLVPLFSALLAVLFLHEHLHLYHLVGAVIIFMGIYLTLNAKSKKY